MTGYGDVAIQSSSENCCSSLDCFAPLNVMLQFIRIDTYIRVYFTNRIFRKGVIFGADGNE
jgi:hypothetical protein